MNQETYKDQSLVKAIGQLLNLLIGLLLIIIGLTIALIHYMPEYHPEEEKTQTNISPVFTHVSKSTSGSADYWHAPDLALLDDRTKGEIVYGKELITHTARYFGPAGTILKASTNGMNCQNCHLDAGTKVFGNNYSAVASTYPRYRARSGTTETVFKRVNDCFERSLNGKALDTSSKEMKSIVAYILWLGKDVGKNKKPEGSGLKELALLDRAASPDKGKFVYTQKCSSCHQPNGEGLLNGDKTEFTYPPLWGDKSYNTGAGLYRLSNFARFVKYNMPLGASHDNIILTDEEAWDVAAFVNSQAHPKKNQKKDWPNIAEKPFDHPFGPYSDNFTEEQHKYGPFQPIKDKVVSSKKK